MLREGVTTAYEGERERAKKRKGGREEVVR